MSRQKLDPRLNAFTRTLADARLKGRVDAQTFVDGRPMRVRAPQLPLRVKDDPRAPYDSELIQGEPVLVFSETDRGSAWVQSEIDGYVGYVARDALTSDTPEPTHWVTALRTFVYPGPDMKLPPVSALTMGSWLALEGPEIETRGTRFLRLAGTDQAVVTKHVLPVGTQPAPDFVSVAETFVHVPYQWGGRTSLGLDCSALVQVALMMTGTDCPRDTDMQVAELGDPVPEGVTDLKRGDLIFWPGHVAIVADQDSLLHASGYHMTVVKEPLRPALERIARTSGAPTAVKRL